MVHLLSRFGVVLVLSRFLCIILAFLSHILFMNCLRKMACKGKVGDRSKIAEKGEHCLVILFILLK